MVRASGVAPVVVSIGHSLLSEAVVVVEGDGHVLAASVGERVSSIVLSGPLLLALLLAVAAGALSVFSP